MVRPAIVALSAFIMLLASCARQSEAPRPELLEMGRQFLLVDEPEGATGIIDYRESKAANTGGQAASATQVEAAEVTLLGRIGGGKPVWATDSAMFLLCDPTQEVAAEGHHDCHDDNCPFCKGKAKPDDSKAIVMLTDAVGCVPAVDARKMLPLAEGQIVVVSGRAEINSLGQLVVHARGLYVRR